MRAMTWAGLLLLAGCAAEEGVAPAGLGSLRPAGPRPGLDEAVRRMPAEAAEFRRGETVWHERNTPGLGATTDYAGPGRAAVATASLYDRGVSAVTPTMLSSEFESAEGEVVALADRRTNHRLESRERFTQPVPGGSPLLCSRLEASYGRQPVQTVVCLGEAAGRYLKLQVTSPARQVRPVEPMPFIIEVTRALRGA